MTHFGFVYTQRGRGRGEGGEKTDIDTDIIKPSGK